MLRFVLRRGALVLPSLLGLLVVTFLLIHSVPSDPAVALAGESATPEQIERLRKQYGLDRPIWEQFVVYVEKVARLDFGESAFSKRPVTLDIIQRTSEPCPTVQKRRPLTRLLSPWSCMEL